MEKAIVGLDEDGEHYLIAVRGPVVERLLAEYGPWVEDMGLNLPNELTCNAVRVWEGVPKDLGPTEPVDWSAGLWRHLTPEERLCGDHIERHPDWVGCYTSNQPTGGWSRK